YGDNSLLYFHQYQNAKPGEPLYERARRGTNIAVPGTPFAALFGDLRDDVRRNRLPQVSWIVAPEVFSEHGNWPPNYGAWYVSQVLDALTSNREVWSKRDLAVEQGRLVDPRLREAQRRPGGAAGYLGLRAARSRAAPRLRPDAAGAAGAARAGARAAVRPRAALRAAGRRLHARRRQRVPDRLRQHGRGRRDTVVRDLSAGESFRPRWWLGKSFGWYDLLIRVDTDPGFLRQLAGHVENGRDSASDPAIRTA
ncbi:MAG TPA: alkaline phosphatase family protein, partial [Candidatus Binatia bacterium]|nr:alkaline phosphatase family protein [Candidatus Binatia bacterium]